jgi:hypothetical protein
VRGRHREARLGLALAVAHPREVGGERERREAHLLGPVKHLVRVRVRARVRARVRVRGRVSVSVRVRFGVRVGASLSSTRS